MAKRLNNEQKETRAVEIISKLTAGKKKDDIKKEVGIGSDTTYYNEIKRIFKFNVNEEAKLESVIQILHQKYMVVDIAYTKVLHYMRLQKKVQDEGKFDKFIEWKLETWLRMYSEALDKLEAFKSKIGLVPREGIDLTVVNTSIFDNYDNKMKEILKKYKSVLDNKETPKLEEPKT